MSDPKEREELLDEDTIIELAPGVLFDDDDNLVIDDSHPEIREARQEMFPHLYEENND